MDEDTTIDPVTLATDLTIAWLGNSNTRASADDISTFLQSMFTAVTSLKPPTEPEPADAERAAPVAAVTVRKSLASPDHILSMIDGKPYRTLRRHLTGHGLTPDDYRARYGLKADYPMVAPAYSEARRAMAKKIGLGRKPGEKIAAKASPAVPVKRGRPAKATGANSVKG